MADPDYISPGYFRTLGIRLLRGREFGTEDGPRDPRVVIINQTLAGRLWPNQEAVGRRIRIGGEEGFLTVAGVAPDGTAFAKGLAEVSAAEIVGRRRGVEAVHRDRLVLY